MNKPKKTVYAMILVLGGAALLIDRLLFGKSLPPAAAESRSLSELGVETTTALSVSVAAAPFPNALPEYGPPADLRDVFAPTDRVRTALLGLQGDRDTAASRRGGRPEAVTADMFRKTHRLAAVMVAKEVSFAIVDGAWLRIGDSLDGCTLTEITGTSVSFKCANDLTSLSVVENPSVQNE